MNERNPPSAPADTLDLARLKAEIREALARRRALGSVIEIPDTFNAELRTANLQRVEQLADIGAGAPELPRFRGTLRFAARLLARVVLYLSRFLTSRQRESNHAVLNALRNFHQGLARLEEQQRQLRADVERMAEQQRGAGPLAA